MTESSDPLFTPFTLKGLTLRNRIVSTSHEPAYSDDGLPKDRYRAYHVAKARGGVGLTMIGGSAIVSRESAPAFGNLQLWKDESEPLLRVLADEVHEHGAAVMIQLTHLGHRTSNYTHDWIPAMSVSAVREPAHRAFAKAAEDWELDRLVDDFVSAAQMCRSAGLDGIELSATGHLLDAFWTPYWNHREDEYGGSHEARMRFPLRLIRAVREAVGEDYIVGTRMTFDEQREGGLEPDEGIQIAQEITEAGIDFISLLRSSIGTDADMARMIPPMNTPAAPHLEFAGQVKSKLDIPVMHAARIADVETARYAIREGLLDLVGMTRALIADPELPNKVQAGQTDRIRPCVGASVCIDGIYRSGAAYCIHNASTGRELQVPQRISPAEARRKAAVVGGGPGGLEAARVLAERGHEVTLFEASDKLGGQLLLASLPEQRRDLRGIIDWRIQELRRLGVTVRTNSYVEAEELSDGGWDLIIVATGGVPASPQVPGGEHALDTWDILSGSRTVRGGSVLVYDDHGGTQAMDTALKLAQAGCEVELVTPEREVAIDVGAIVSAAYFHDLATNHVRTTTIRRLRGIRRDGGRYQVDLGVDGFDFVETREVDLVVAEEGTDAVADLYEELAPQSTNGGAVDLEALLSQGPQEIVRNPEGGFQLFRIGDAVVSRSAQTAILDATRLCQSL